MFNADPIMMMFHECFVDILPHSLFDLVASDILLTILLLLLFSLIFFIILFEMFCRLCGLEKSDEELVKSLSDNVGIITFNLTFKELFEYYSRIELDNNFELPQKICKSCKNFFEKYVEFVCKFEEIEKKRIATLKPCEVKVEHKERENFQDQLPKRQRLDETFEEHLLEEVACPIAAPESSVAKANTKPGSLNHTLKQEEVDVLQHGSKASFSNFMSIDTQMTFFFLSLVVHVVELAGSRKTVWKVVAARPI